MLNETFQWLRNETFGSDGFLLKFLSAGKVSLSSGALMETFQKFQ